MFTISHIVRVHLPGHSTAWPSTSGMQKHMSARTLQELKVHFTGACQGLVLKTDLSLACAVFKQPRPAELTLSSTEFHSQIAETREKEKNLES